MGFGAWNDGMIILRWKFRKWYVGKWTYLVKDRGGWRALSKLVMNFRVPQISGNFLTI
jgi:hypothetical protein